MILISDLDRTLIYSKKSFINEYSGDYVCIEKNGEREITYVTSHALPLIKKLFSVVPLIPCTMRSFKQTMRIDFIKEMGFNTCICSNGAEIYIEGVKDLDWENTITSYIDNNKLLGDIELLRESLFDYDVDIRNILGYYIEVRCPSEQSAYVISEIVREYIRDENIHVFATTNKVFAIDKRINKETAILYLRKKLGLKDVISGGDAEVDLEMLLISNYSVAPKHKTFDGKFDYVTESTSILAGEELLKHLIEYCNIN